MFRILLIEDDTKLRQLIEESLRKYGYQPVAARDYATLKQQFLEAKPDLVLMDVNLPLYDGFYWCRQIRTASTVPIIFLSARAGAMDQVLAMENGADDYVTKPFSMDVLLAKVRSVLRRAYGEYATPVATSRVWSAGRLLLDEARSIAGWDDMQVELSGTEFQLLALLAHKAGTIVTREELLEAIWDDVSFVDDNTLTVNVTRVRKKLADIGCDGVIATKRGQGYMLQLDGANHG